MSTAPRSRWAPPRHRPQIALQSLCWKVQPLTCLELNHSGLFMDRLSSAADKMFWLPGRWTCDYQKRHKSGFGSACGAWQRRGRWTPSEQGALWQPPTMPSHGITCSASKLCSRRQTAMLFIITDMQGLWDITFINPNWRKQKLLHWFLGN